MENAAHNYDKSRRVSSSTNQIKLNKEDRCGCKNQANRTQGETKNQDFIQAEEWSWMSPEERTKFIDESRKRCVKQGKDKGQDNSKT